MQIIERQHFDTLLQSLQQSGYTTLGPVLRDGVVLYDEISSSADMPAGWTDDLESGTYRTRKTKSPQLFAYTLSPNSWKKYLYPPRVRLFGVHRQGKLLKIDTADNKGAGVSPRYAFVGVRACELAAIARQDAIFMEGPYADPLYRKRREESFILAVQCGRAGATCFCDSLGTGPAIQNGYDLLLTEIMDKDAHYFTAQSGSPRGAAVLNEVPHRAASNAEQQLLEKILRNAKSEMGRSVNMKNIARMLANNLESPVWSDIAKRCMTCANCTMVCPTCFCSTTEDTVDLGQTGSERFRRWDSCFTLDFGKVAGGNFRSSASARYRQWLTHKFSFWEGQFGTPGCVGCGRCVTWCPAHIDITKELDRIRAESVPVKPQPEPTTV